MTNKKKPITFNIDKDTISAIEAYKGRTHSVSTSAIIRAAIERFDFDHLDTPTNETKQVSLRLDSVVRDKLKAVAKSQGVSVGFILRECIMDFVTEDRLHPLPRAGHSLNQVLEKPVNDEPDDPWQI